MSEALKESCNLVVVISSKDCFTPKEGEEDYYLREISDALGQGKNIVPVYYDEVKYDDIEGALKNSHFNMKNFPKHQAVFYHNDNPEGSIDQIDSFLKTEEDILNEQFRSLSKKRNQIRQELLYLKENNSGKCPICQSDYDATMSYCQKCAYKFFSELDKSVAEASEVIQEESRKKRHVDIWEKYQQDRAENLNIELIELKKRVEDLETIVQSKNEELALRDQQLVETKKALKDSVERLREVENNMTKYGPISKVSSNIKTLIQVIGDKPKSYLEMQEVMSVKNKASLSRHYIMPAIQEGYIENICPNSSSHTKYQLTDLGKKIYENMDINK